MLGPPRASLIACGRWWKVKIKESVDETEGGLVPAAYVETVSDVGARSGG